MPQSRRKPNPDDNFSRLEAARLALAEKKLHTGHFLPCATMRAIEVKQPTKPKLKFSI